MMIKQDIWSSAVLIFCFDQDKIIIWHLSFSFTCAWYDSLVKLTAKDIHAAKFFGSSERHFLNAEIAFGEMNEPSKFWPVIGH